MADEKVPGGPPPESQPVLQGQPGTAPPPYTAGPQGGAYPPQPQGAYPLQPGQPVAGYQTTVVVQPGSGAMPGSSFRYMQQPALVVCQHCNATVTTTLSYESGMLTYVAAGVICLFGCWLGCCLIPFCVDASKDVTHTCPNCHKMVGKFRHFS